MATFELKLWKTYYEKGFFNVPVDIDKFIRKDDGPISIILGSQRLQIEGRAYHSANLNGTARIFGNALLRDWFKENFVALDTVTVEILAPDKIKLG